MRAVADTNVVVSGLLWSGPSSRILDLAKSERVALFTSPALLAELGDVLSRRKFARRLKLGGWEPQVLVHNYAALAQVILAARVLPIIVEDPDDDEILACALAAQVDVIVTGDRHLLSLTEYQGIRIVRPVQLLVP